MQILPVGSQAVVGSAQRCLPIARDARSSRIACHGPGSQGQLNGIRRAPQLLSSRRPSRLVGHDSASSTWPSEPAEATEEVAKQIPEAGNGISQSDIEASTDDAATRVGLSSRGSKKLAGFWGAYSKALEDTPIRVKSATSFFGFLLGDAVAQLIVGNPYNYLRTARMVIFGILMDGPIGKARCTCNSAEQHLVVPSSTP